MTEIYGYVILNKKTGALTRVWSKTGPCRSHITCRKKYYYSNIDDFVILPLVAGTEIPMIDFIDKKKVFEAMKG